ncbi:MAG: GNAT family N-acetyltransferase [Planctomycetota bacterium]
MKIRPFTRRDVRGMLAVAKKLHPKWFHESRLKSMPVDLHCQRGFAAVEQNKIVGFISYSSEGGVPYIARLGVDPALHRKGIGRKLVAATEHDLHKTGADILQVTAMGWTRPVSRPHSDTLKFYSALGFKPVKKHPIHVEGGERWRLYTLEKKLSRPIGSRRRGGPRT